MNMKYILYSKNHKTNEAGEAWTFKYQPTDPILRKHCCFSVSTDDPYETLGELNLPDSIGDIIELDLKPSNIQSKLSKGKKEAVD